MKNKEVANLLYQIAQLLNMGDESIFRIRAYERASQVIESLPSPIEEADRKGTLADIPGVGEGIAEKIHEYLQNGSLAYLKELEKKFPQGLLEIMAIPGVGPKKAKVLFKKLRIESVEELKAASKAGKIRKLEGFGPKSEENILKGIELVERSAGRMLLSEAHQTADEMIGLLSADTNILQISYAGSLRREKETIGDIDLLCSVRKGGEHEVIERFTHLPVVQRVIAQGETKISIITTAGRQVDLRIVEDRVFGAALQYFTGSKEHNVALRGLAKQKGYTINEYGIFRLEDKKKAVASRSEEEIYNTLGLSYIPPQMREDRGEIKAAREHSLPRLVELKDIKGDTHVHSTYSDGLNTIKEMAEKARSLGYEWIISCDHSRSLKIARGLDIASLHRKLDEISELNSKLKGFHILSGIELDILGRGELDYPDSVLEKVDFVVAAIHSGFKQTEEEITARVTAALENPNVHCIAHPTGRLLNKRNPYAINMERVLEAAAKFHKLLEINAFPERLDLYDTYCQRARDMGVAMAIGSDAHTIDHLGYMYLGIAVAQRGWLEKKDLINTLSYHKLMSLLKKIRTHSYAHA